MENKQLIAIISWMLKNVRSSSEGLYQTLAEGIEQGWWEDELDFPVYATELLQNYHLDEKIKGEHT